MPEVLAAVLIVFGPLAWLLIEAFFALNSSGPPARTLPVVSGGSDRPVPDVPSPSVHGTGNDRRAASAK